MAPEGYTDMRDKFIKEGTPEKEAKTKAAKIWNKEHPDEPVTNKKHEEGVVDVPGQDSRILVEDKADGIDPKML